MNNMNNMNNNVGLESLFKNSRENANPRRNSKASKKNLRRSQSNMRTQKRKAHLVKGESQKTHPHLWPQTKGPKIEIIKTFKSNSRTEAIITLAKLETKNKANILNNSTDIFVIKKKQILNRMLSDKKKNDIYKRFTIECSIYEILMQFIIRNISPHVISGGICEKETDTENDYLSIYNETFNPEHYDVIFLKDFIIRYIQNPLFENALINILFQVVYTLRCFNIINLNHNDLHVGNILIFIDKENNILNSEFTLQKYNKYTFDDNTLELLDLGIYAFIFDFDGSNKNKADDPVNQKLKVEIKQPDYGNAYENSIYNNQTNNYADIYKLLFDIFNDIFLIINKKLISDIILGQNCKIFFKLLAYFIYLKFSKNSNITESSILFVNYLLGIKPTEIYDKTIFKILWSLYKHSILFTFKENIDDIRETKDKIDELIETNTDDIEKNLQNNTLNDIIMYIQLIGITSLARYGIMTTITGQTFIPKPEMMMEPKRFLLYIAAELHTLQETLKGDPKFRNESSPDLTQENQYSTANIFN
jgi:hypothetical protein